MSAGVIASSAYAGATFHDSTGEAAGAADITTVAVSDNPTTTSVSFAIRFRNMPAFTTLDDRVEIAVDGDARASTGYLGIDCMIETSLLGAQLLRWNGHRFVQVVDAELGGSFRRGLLNVVTGIGACPATRHFRFRVITYRYGDAGPPRRDVAPDEGRYRYTADSKAGVPVARVVVMVGAPPRAGTPFMVVGMTIYFTDGVSTYASSVRCHGALAGRPLTGQGIGGCIFPLAATTRGKQIAVEVAGNTADGRRYRKRIRYTVR